MQDNAGRITVKLAKSVCLCGVALLLTLGLAKQAAADVTLPAIFSDHMVLQCDAEVPVWGWAAPDEEVTVTIGGQTKKAKPAANGRWIVRLDKMKAGETVTLTVKGKNTITITDVLVGEVWLCSGQSNMAWSVVKARNFDVEKAAATYPKIRMFREASGGAVVPQEKCNGKWEICSPETVGGFSATAYFFGRSLHQKINMPVGLINSSVGGTPIESWTSIEAQGTLPEMKEAIAKLNEQAAKYNPEEAKAAHQKQMVIYKEAVAKAKAEGKPVPRPPQMAADPRARGPGNLFNGKIASLIPFAIRGAIWYQGESNAFTQKGGKLYEKQLPLMIQDWRKRWGYDFPFAWVQLPNFRSDRFAGWCEVRESMLKSLKVPNTGMAIALELGDPKDIHPKNKQEVGQRLALWALAKVYGQNIPFSGPLPAGHEIKGEQVVCSFLHTDGGLKTKEGDVKGFVIAGADKKWVPATAKIEGDKVVVSSPEVKQPVAVRYAWKDDPEFNLYNGAGLPASPFRTDDWE